MAKIEPYKGIAGIYEEIRPTYPEKLIEDIITKTGLKQNAILLEIGAGTGKATIPFAARGFTIHANEIGEDMAEILRDKCADYPNVSVDVIPFEEWQAPGNQKFDMIYCAQAFHWIDKSVKYHKCHNLLKDGGHLVLFWYNPITEKLPESQAIEAEVNQIIQKYITDYSADHGIPERRAHDGVSDNDERKAEILESGLFDLVEKLEYTNEIRNNPSQYLKAMKSVPAFASVLDRLEEEVTGKLEDEITGVINRHGGYSGTLFQFTLYLAKRR
jgi:SAM-dependent methyltransferase